MGDNNLREIFEEDQHEYGLSESNIDAEDLYSIFESLDSVTEFPPLLESQQSTAKSLASLSDDNDTSCLPKSKRKKTGDSEGGPISCSIEETTNQDGQQRMSHITVERNRRKQMNEHLSVLRSLMPCFYVKRGDQASIIGGVVDYINELQQILQSLEAKKQRKAYTDVLSPRIVNSPRSISPLSPRKPPLSPRLTNLPPISPRTPQPPSSPYNKHNNNRGGYLSPTMASLEPSSTTSSSNSSSVNDASRNELVANSKSAIADVEVKFSGANLVLKTLSPKIPGQVVKIISALEDLALEILQVNIGTVDDTMFNSFTIKIGIECQLSAEELAQQVQQTF